MEFKLYSRSNCQLCENMEEELRPFVKQYNITVTRRYIDNEPGLEQQFGSRVPVLMRENKVLCEYFLDPEVLLNEISQ